MRDGSGNKMSPEEQQKVKSIQGAPDPESLNTISINPGNERDTGESDKSSRPPKLPPGLKGEE
jgi:hypothetical protein